MARPAIQYASIARGGQSHRCAIPLFEQHIHGVCNIYPNLFVGPPAFPVTKSGNALAHGQGTHSKQFSRAHMVSLKTFRREVCPNNPRLVVSVCVTCNRKAASRDLRLLLLAENLHECWPKKSGQMPPTRGTLKTKPSSEPSK